MIRTRSPWLATWAALASVLPGLANAAGVSISSPNAGSGWYSYHNQVVLSVSSSGQFDPNGYYDLNAVSLNGATYYINGGSLSDGQTVFNVDTTWSSLPASQMYISFCQSGTCINSQTFTYNPNAVGPNTASAAGSQASAAATQAAVSSSIPPTITSGPSLAIANGPAGAITSIPAPGPAASNSASPSSSSAAPTLSTPLLAGVIGGVAVFIGVMSMGLFLAYRRRNSKDANSTGLLIHGGKPSPGPAPNLMVGTTNRSTIRGMDSSPGLNAHRTLPKDLSAPTLPMPLVLTPESQQRTLQFSNLGLTPQTSPEISLAPVPNTRPSIDTTSTVRPSFDAQPAHQNSKQPHALTQIRVDVHPSLTESTWNTPVLTTSNVSLPGPNSTLKPIHSPHTSPRASPRSSPKADLSEFAVDRRSVRSRRSQLSNQGSSETVDRYSVYSRQSISDTVAPEVVDVKGKGRAVPIDYSVIPTAQPAPTTAAPAAPVAPVAQVSPQLGIKPVFKVAKVEASVPSPDHYYAKIGQMSPDSLTVANDDASLSIQPTPTLPAEPLAEMAPAGSRLSLPVVGVHLSKASPQGALTHGLAKHPSLESIQAQHGSVDTA